MRFHRLPFVSGLSIVLRAVLLIVFCHSLSAEQFVLFDVTFTYTKEDAENSKPSKSHFYVKGDLLNPNRPKDWTAPIDYRNGTAHIRAEIIDKPPGGEPTTWTICYIPNRGQGNGYGCTGTDLYREKGVYEKDVSMTSFWENDSIIWTEGIKQMDLVIKDGSGGSGHAHKRPDHEKFFPTKVRLTVVQVSAGAKYDPSLVPNLPPSDLLIADFESEDYGAWKATGEAFGPGPARGTLPGQMTVNGYEGQRLVNSFYKGDSTIGTLTSPPFKIERNYITFLIGGGQNLAKTALNLLIDGQVARQATGPNAQPGGSEQLAPDSWDVRDLAGKTGVLQIVDHATGGWGHINVDHIVQTDRRPPALLTNATRAFKIEKRYLNLPIKNGPTRKVTTLVDGRVEVRNDIGLADGQPDWWAFMDVSAWRGKTVTLQVDRLREGSTALSAIEQSDEIKDAANLYREPLRGQFHFSPRRGWNNDPNGLVYYNGEYHLFFQHNPYGWAWGNMHWGHAVSRDLVHWQELGDVLAPDSSGPMFSGSAVVDWQNSSGLAKDGKPPLILFYTAAGDPAVQSLAFSTDGRTFTKFSGNPIVPQFTPGNRDPKVIWHEPTRKWVMTLYVETNKVHGIYFLGSTNLKDWSYLSRTDGFFECPDFFELPVDGDPARKKWVLTAANSEYQLGSFDGTTFKPETPKVPGHRGRGFYAAQTFSEIPANDGRRIQIGWFQTETRGMPFNQSMTIPLVLNLVSTSDGPRLTWRPAKELETLRASTSKIDDITLQPGRPNPFSHLQIMPAEIRVDIRPIEPGEITFTIRGATVRYDTAKEEIAVNGHRAPAPLRNGVQRLIIYCDRTGLELFASDGLTYIPMPFIPQPNNRSLSVEATSGTTALTNLRLYELNSIWRDSTQ